MKKPLKITLSLLAGFIVFSILHNAFYAIFGFEEPVFFFLSLLSGLGFIFSLIYNLAILIKKKLTSAK